MAIVIANFHRRRVLPLMERKLPLFQMTRDAPFEGTRMMEESLSDDVSAQRAARAVSQPPNNHADYWRVSMRPDAGYINVVNLIPSPRRRHCFSFSNPGPVRRGCMARATPRILCSQKSEP